MGCARITLARVGLTRGAIASVSRERTPESCSNGIQSEHARKGKAEARAEAKTLARGRDPQNLTRTEGG